MVEEVVVKAEPERAPSEASDKKFSQADMDRIAGDTRQSAKSAAQKELLDALGVTDLDAAKAALVVAKEAEDAKLTETERLTRERDEAKAEVEAERGRSTTLLAMTKLEGALRDSGITPERLPAAMKLADFSALKVDGTDVAGIPEAIEGVKALSPEWFGKTLPGAVDVSQGGSASVTEDFRTATRSELAAAAAKYGVKL